MQFLWKYIDDIVGKGLDSIVIVKLLVYVSASLVPMALPLAILLSSLMTFGNLGENYELVAFKSAGISLKRVLRPLGVVVVLLSIIAYLFSNYWLPIANLKSKSLLYDVKKQKPTMDIRPGIFSDGLDNFSIKVKDKKVIDDVEHLYDLMIYDHRSPGNRSVTVAKEGIMTISDNKRYLVLTLFNGENYDENFQRKNNYKYPLARTRFEENIIRFDLAQFNLNRTDEDLFKSNYKMLNMDQLDKAIDTLSTIRNNHLEKFREGIYKSYYRFAGVNQEIKADTIVRGSPSPSEVLAMLPINKQRQIYATAGNLARNAKSRLDSMVSDLNSRDKYIRYHKIYWHKKLTLSFACFILFLIGAPLGAIIRKGGLGMPIVISVIFFLIFHMLSITGEKMAKEGAIEVVRGMWLASAVLFPVGVFFTYKATSDSSFFRMDNYLYPIKKLFKKKEKPAETS
jgi:lipopolysaccharide export system permease protein